MKLRLLGLLVIALSFSLVTTSCRTMPKPGGKPGVGAPSGTPSGFRPSRGWFPRP